MAPAELGVEIARRIAAREGVETAALNPPLHAVVDVDALESLIHSRPDERTDFTGVVSFAYGEYTVTVDHTGSVSITPLEDADPNPGDGPGRQFEYSSQ
ncbi:HalOD1 output domain-containing protein [Natronococcus sp.]|uniref:HalOD1 output domain-containing protein n=1 Tax=Natronococcus sp. TaxID=35747 RepID=UPI003A4D6E62